MTLTVGFAILVVMRLMKNDVIECDVETLGIYGEGIARAEGKTIFIKGALPGERVRAKIIFDRPSFCDAKLEIILKNAPERIKPVCPVFGVCGGCALQHADYRTELDYKKKRLDETFLKVADLAVASLEPVASDCRMRYRNKLSMPVRQAGGTIRIGFFARESHRVVNVEDCFLQPVWVVKLIETLRSVMTDNGLSGYAEESGNGHIRHIAAREIGGRLFITVVSANGGRAIAEPLQKAFSRAFGADCRLYLNFNRKKTNVIYGDEWLKLSGGDEPLHVDGVRMDVHPAGFFQVNDNVRKKLYAAAAAEVGGTVIDAYAGAGLMSAVFARTAERVIGIELDPAAAESAERTRALNRIGNLENVRGDCGQVLPGIMKRYPAADVVLDPPRQGADERALAAIGESEARKVVYISCNPATLARDCKRLLRYGFTVASTRAYDMFPMTASMESLTVLIRGSGGRE